MKVLKEKQKLAGKGLGQAGQAFLGGSAKQTPVSPKKKATATKPKPKAKAKPRAKSKPRGGGRQASIEVEQGDASGGWRIAIVPSMH